MKKQFAVANGNCSFEYLEQDRVKNIFCFLTFTSKFSDITSLGLLGLAVAAVR